MSGEMDWFSPDADETVVWTGQPRVWRIWRPIASGLVASVVALAVAYYVTTRPSVLPASASSLPVDAIAWGVAALVVLSQVHRAVVAYLRVQKTDYLLTNKRLYRKEGILSEHTASVGLDRIQETTLSKDITGNLFDYGTVAISTAGSSGTDLALTDLTDPETFRDHLREQVREATPDDGDAGRPRLDADRVAALTDEVRALRQVARRLEGST